MPNKSEKYVNEMNRLVFSDDIQERIMSNLLKQKKKSRKIYFVMAALTTIFLCLIGVKETGILHEMQSDLLCEEDVEKPGYVSSVKDIFIDVNSKIDDFEIDSDQMVILNIRNVQSDTGALSLTGHLTGDDRDYSYGYIVDQNYIEVLSDCAEEFIEDQVDIKDGAEYSLYIINYSEKTLTFSGNVFAHSLDLVYRDYGSEAVQIEENSTIKIDLSGLCDSYDMEGVYLYNCITRQTIQFPPSSVIEYENERAGVYIIYALTTEGERIGLSERITVEVECNIKEGSGVIGL